MDKSFADPARPARRRATSLFALLTGLLLVLDSHSACAYGWTAHWRVMESNWTAVTMRLCGMGALKLRAFKDLSDEERAYAAVGAVFSDIGYTAAGPRQFSDLVHYIGTGEFTDNLTDVVCERYPGNARMLAFAAGFRTHYWADRIGHGEGTNRAVAKVSAKRSAFLDRMTYEEDPAAHRMLEVATFSAFDLDHAAANAAIAFIRDAGNGALADTILGSVDEAIRRTYGNAAVAFAPRYQQVVLFTFSVMRSVCATVDKVYGSGARSVSLKDLVKTCYQRTKRGDIPAEADPSPQLIAMISAGLAQSRDKRLEEIYEKSIQRVDAALRVPFATRLPNYNLDTNLPSVSGQYRLADTAYELLVKVMPARCDPLGFAAIANGEPSNWRSYQSAGVCADRVARAMRSRVDCRALYQESGVPELLAGWLSDIAPQYSSSRSTATCKLGKSGAASTTFILGNDCSVTATTPLSTLEFLYGCAAGQPSQARNEHMRYEAVDRLRIHATIDQPTGLYTH
jgi:hypothetical protein